MTALVWQYVFKTDVPFHKQIAIVLITVGIIFKDFGQRDEAGSIIDSGVASQQNDGLGRFVGIGSTSLILFQMLSSVLAGVVSSLTAPYYFSLWSHFASTICVPSFLIILSQCNEKLLKDDACSQNIQNMALYLDSIGINLIIAMALLAAMFINGEADAIDVKALLATSPSSILIVWTLATAGIISSMVLRHVNSITKGVASASEMVLIAIVECLFYGHVYTKKEVLGMAFACFGMVVFGISPSMAEAVITQQSHLRGLRRTGVVLCGGLSLSAGLAFHTYHLLPAGDVLDELGILFLPPSNQASPLKVDESSKATSGILACIESRDDVIHAMALAESFKDIYHTTNLRLELYHSSRLSPYLSALIESVEGVNTIDITRFNLSDKDCLSDSLSVTRLENIIVIEPFTLLLPRGLKATANEEDAKATSRVTTTSAKVAATIDSLSSQGLEFEHISYRHLITSGKVETIRSGKGGSGYIGHYHQSSNHLPFDYVLLDRDVITWASYYAADDAICPNCPMVAVQSMRSALKKYRVWLSKVMLDRPSIGWVSAHYCMPFDNTSSSLFL